MLTSAPAATTATSRPPLNARRRNRGDASRPGTSALASVGGDLRRRPRNPVVDLPARRRSLSRLLQADEEHLRLHLVRVSGQQRDLEDRLVRIGLVDLEPGLLDLLRRVVDDRDVPGQPLLLRQPLTELGVRELVRLAEVLPRDRGEDEAAGDLARLDVERDLLARREELRWLVRERRLLRGAGVADPGNGKRDHAGDQDQAGEKRDRTARSRAHGTQGRRAPTALG